MHRHWRAGLLALCGITIVLSVTGIYDQHRSARCLANYEETFAVQSLARSNLTVSQTDATADVINGVGALLLRPPGKTPAAQQKTARDMAQLFATFQQRTDAITAQKRDHPLPTSPKGCH